MLFLVLIVLKCLIHSVGGEDKFVPGSGLRTYNGWNREYRSYTSSGTLIIEELDPLAASSSFLGLAPTISSSSSTATTTSNDAPITTPFNWPSSFSCFQNTERGKTARNGLSLSIPASYESASCCDNRHSQWADLTSQYFHPPPEMFAPVSTSRGFHTRHFSIASCNGPFTTFCDGVTRAMCSPQVVMQGIQLMPKSRDITSQTVSFTRSTLPEDLERLQPSCKVDDDTCNQMWEYQARELENWNGRVGLFDEFSNTTSGTGEDNKPPIIQPPICLNQNHDRCLQCGFHNETVQMLYWNVDADETHLCPGKDTILSSIGTISPLDKPATAVWQGFTLTSPTVYAFYTQMAEEMGCGGFHTSVLVPIDPTEVSTMVFPVNTDDHLPMVSRVDFRHFAYTTIGSHSVPLIPKRAYCGDNRQIILPGECSTIYHDYRPGVVFRIDSEVLRSIDPAWRYCRKQQFMAWDPPIILHVETGVTLAPATLPTSVGPSPALGIEMSVTATTGQPIHRTEQQSDLGMLEEVGVFVNKVSIITMYASAAQGDDELAMNRHTPTRYRPLPGGQDAPRLDQVVFTAADRQFTGNRDAKGDFVVDGRTLSQNGPVQTINGVGMSAFDGGIVIESNIVISSNAVSSQSSATDGQGITIGHGREGTTSTSKKNEAMSHFGIAWLGRKVFVITIAGLLLRLTL